MTKALLEQCIKELLKEAKPSIMPQFQPTQKPLELIDTPKVIPQKYSLSDYVLTRDVAFKMSPELASAIQLADPDALAEIMQTGVINGEIELYLDFNPRYSPGTPDRTYGPPDNWMQGDPEEFEVEDFVVEKIFVPGAKFALLLSDEDARRAAEHVGNLTEDEIENFRERYVDNLDDGPDPGDYYKDRD